MSIKEPKLDDVAILAPAQNLNLTLNEVGLENVQMQVLINGQKISARASASVSLIDPNSRGIHMSRLFKILTQFSQQEFNWSFLHDSLAQILKSHQSLSDSGFIHIRFDLPVLRKALLSQESGWRIYPVEYRTSFENGQWQNALRLRVLYSSTCPCSASISRQALQQQFALDFADENVSRDQVYQWLNSQSSTVATPHSQRSEAVCDLTFEAGSEPATALPFIDLIEHALGTPVQAAVKREDEQEFARLNAQNLMFCEDAARKLKAAFMELKELADFQLEVRHFESLHAHDVVAKARK